MPGALDFTNWWVGEVPERYRGRGFFQYNVEILLMRTNAEEFGTLGNMIGERLAAADGTFLATRVTDPQGDALARRFPEVRRNLIGRCAWLAAPDRSWPAASQNRQAVSVGWVCEADAPRSRLSSGRPGR